MDTVLIMNGFPEATAYTAKWSHCIK